MNDVSSVDTDEYSSVSSSLLNKKHSRAECLRPIVSCFFPFIVFVGEIMEEIMLERLKIKTTKYSIICTNDILPLSITFSRLKCRRP